MKNRLFLLVLVLILISSMNTLAFTTIHEETNEEMISSGVTLKQIKRFTDEGWLNFNILQIDLKDKNTSVKLLNAKDGLNKFDTTLEMAQNEEAIAAINGDFFAGKYTNGYTVGFSAQDGEMYTSGYKGNEVKDEFASFIVEGNSSYIDFIKTTITLTSHLTGEAIEIKEYNRLTDNYDARPVMFTPLWQEKSLGSFPDMEVTELVIVNNTVKEIRTGLEGIPVPEDGYIISAAGTSSEFLKNNFHVGTRVDLKMEANVDISKISTAISGGAVLVKNGTIPETYSSMIYGRNPRSAIGSSQDGKTIYLVTVDGRQVESVGMTQSELSEFLVSQKIYNAINLDGGGSTTMVARKLGEEDLSVLNLPSGGNYLRKVTNSFGDVNTSKTSTLDGLIIEVSDDNVFVNCERNLNIKGYDKYYNPVNIDLRDITFTTSGVPGAITNGILKAGNEAGVITITAKKGKVSTSLTMNILSAPNELEVFPKKSEISSLEKVSFSIIAKNKNGFYGTMENSELTWKIISGDGTFENGVYTPKTDGIHLIEVSAGNAKVYAIVNVTKIEEKEVDYITSQNYTSINYPSEVTASLKERRDGFLKIDYDFSKTNATRASYIRLKEPITLTQKDMKVSVPVIAKDTTDEYIKVKVIDANQETKLLMMQRGFDASEEEVIVSASLEDISFPATLTDIYVGQDNSEILSSGSILLGKLTITSKGDTLDISSINVPQAIKGEDSISSISEDAITTRIALYDQFVEPKTLLDQLKNIRAERVLTENKDAIILTSNANLKKIKTDKTILTPTSYGKNTFENVDIFTIDVSNDGLRKTNYEQWFWLQNDIKNSINKNIIIVMKGTLDSFTDSNERLLFINTLRDLKANFNKNILVIENGPYTEYSMEKRVRYLRINNLGIDTSEPIEVAEQTNYIEIDVSKDDMTYEIKRVF